MARYIDADLLIENIAKIEDLRTLSTKTIGEAISNTPTADVEAVKRGYWKFINQATNYLEAPCGDTCHCSVCGFQIDVSETHFKRCPECGAKMDGGKDE